MQVWYHYGIMSLAMGHRPCCRMFWNSGFAAGDNIAVAQSSMVAHAGVQPGARELPWECLLCQYFGWGITCGVHVEESHKENMRVDRSVWYLITRQSWNEIINYGNTCLKLRSA